MRDLQSARLMWLKAVLFLAIGGVSAALVWAEVPRWRTAGLLVLMIWSFCRLYYFALYVLEKYVDPQFRFAGLISVARYLLRSKKIDGR